jgi:FdrA protein
LLSAGAIVFQDIVEAVAHLTESLTRSSASVDVSVDTAILDPPLSAINVGLEIFSESLTVQGANVVQVDWRPPAGGNENLIALLAKMKST